MKKSKENIEKNGIDFFKYKRLEYKCVFFLFGTLNYTRIDTQLQGKLIGKELTQIQIGLNDLKNAGQYFGEFGMCAN